MASLAAMLHANPQAAKMPTAPLRSLRCVAFSSAPFRWPGIAAYAPLFPPAEAAFTLPALDCHGVMDENVTVDQGDLIVDSFARCTKYRHDFGHMVPSDERSLALYKQWVRSMQ